MLQILRPYTVHVEGAETPELHARAIAAATVTLDMLTAEQIVREIHQSGADMLVLPSGEAIIREAARRACEWYVQGRPGLKGVRVTLEKED